MTINKRYASNQDDFDKQAKDLKDKGYQEKGSKTDRAEVRTTFRKEDDQVDLIG